MAEAKKKKRTHGEIEQGGGEGKPIVNGTVIFWWSDGTALGINDAMSGKTVTKGMTGCWTNPGHALYDAIMSATSKEWKESSPGFPNIRSSSVLGSMWLSQGEVVQMPGDVPLADELTRKRHHFLDLMYTGAYPGVVVPVKMRTRSIVTNRVPLQWIRDIAGPLLMAMGRGSIPVVRVGWGANSLTQDEIVRILSSKVNDEVAEALLFMSAALNAMSGTGEMNGWHRWDVDAALDQVSGELKDNGFEFEVGNPSNVAGSAIVYAFTMGSHDSGDTMCITVLHQVSVARFFLVASAHREKCAESSSSSEFETCMSADAVGGMTNSAWFAAPNAVIYVPREYCSSHFVMHAFGLHHNWIACGCVPREPLSFLETHDVVEPSGMFACTCVHRIARATTPGDFDAMLKEESAAMMIQARIPGDVASSELFPLLGHLLYGRDVVGSGDGIIPGLVSKGKYDAAIRMMDWITSLDVPQRIRRRHASDYTEQKVTRMKGFQKALATMVHSMFCASIADPMAVPNPEIIAELAAHAMRMLGSENAVDYIIAGLCRGCASSISSKDYGRSHSVPSSEALGWEKGVMLALEAIEKQTDAKPRSSSSKTPAMLKRIRRVSTLLASECMGAPYRCAEAGHMDLACELVGWVGFGLSTASEKWLSCRGTSGFGTEIDLLGALVKGKRIIAGIHGDTTSSQILIPMMVLPDIWDLGLLSLVLADDRLDGSIANLALALAADSIAWELSEMEKGRTLITTTRSELFSGGGGVPDFTERPLEMAYETPYQPQEFHAWQSIPDWDYEEERPASPKPRRVIVRPDPIPFSWPFSAASLASGARSNPDCGVPFPELHEVRVRRGKTYCERACRVMMRSGRITDIRSDAWRGGSASLPLSNMGIHPPLEWWRMSPLAIFAGQSLWRLIHTAASLGLAAIDDMCMVLNTEQQHQIEEGEKSSTPSTSSRCGRSGCALQLMLNGFAAGERRSLVGFVAGLNERRGKRDYRSHREISEHYQREKDATVIPKASVLIDLMGVDVDSTGKLNVDDVDVLVTMNAMCKNWNCKLW
jgi:hypothetical protein